MADVYGWRYPFVILGAAGVVLGLALAVFIREPLRNEAERREQGEFDGPSPTVAAATATLPETDQGWVRYAWVTLVDVLTFGWELVRNPPALLLVLAFCGANVVAFIFMTWMPSFLREKYQLDLASAGLWATLPMQVASMIGAIVGGILADYWAKNRPGGRSLVQGLGLLVGAPFIYWCGVTPELNTVLIAMTCFGFGKGIYDSNIWASLYDVVPAEKRGKAVGFTNMIGWLGAGGGTTLFGIVVDQGYSMSSTLASTVVIYVGIAGLLALASLLAYRRGAVAS
jgi:MFS family permease